ncbi:AraC family transcriptional regulator [Mangrovibacterium sp.]|uniref:AraC family transcriptional regulator n=1 Tax=Mangrovibacterium sp. TaxID=1961364 RepID=UPI003565F354
MKPSVAFKLKASSLNSSKAKYQLADLMHMSRTSFYRKFKSITDISPKDYIFNFIQKS